MVSQALATQAYEPSAAMPSAPTHIGRFEVRSEIGRGSNGVVYAAFDPVLGRELAIKAIPLAADNLMRRRAEASFLQEAKSAASLNHPGIVTVFDAGKTESVAYIAMERLYGSDLHDWLATRNRLAPKAIASMMARVADAVHYAHRRGLGHRDLKPSNILLTRDMKPKVLDFGVALAAYSDTPLSSNRQLIGTPNCMSPEPQRGPAAQRPGDGGRARGLRPAPHAATRDFRAGPEPAQRAPGGRGARGVGVDRYPGARAAAPRAGGASGGAPAGARGHVVADRA